MSCASQSYWKGLAELRWAQVEALGRSLLLSRQQVASLFRSVLRWRAAAGVCAGAALFLGCWRAVEPPCGAELEEEVVLAPPSVVFTTDNLDEVPAGPKRRLVPNKDQKKPPCAAYETEVAGACWVPVDKKPCPKETVLWEGRCLLPVGKTPSKPVAVEP